MEPKLTLEETKEAVATLKYPRVTEESIKAKIASIIYLKHDITIICLITMQNGFVFVGTSTPASPENYNSDIGDRYAYENAFKQIWTHEGYLLKEKLSND